MADKQSNVTTMQASQDGCNSIRPEHAASADLEAIDLVMVSFVASPMGGSRKSYFAYEQELVETISYVSVTNLSHSISFSELDA